MGWRTNGAQALGRARAPKRTILQSIPTEIGPLVKVSAARPPRGTLASFSPVLSLATSGVLKCEVEL